MPEEPGFYHPLRRISLLALFVYGCKDADMVKFSFSSSANKPLRNSSSRPNASPFLPPKPHVMILPALGKEHHLLLNEYCVFRPMLLVTTREFRLQTGDLERSDCRVAWAVLRTLESGGRGYVGVGDDRSSRTVGRPQEMRQAEGRRCKYMATYSCDYEAGASQMHRHLQVHPSPEFGLWIEMVKGEDIEDRVESVPYRHFLVGPKADMGDVTGFELYQKVLRRSNQVMRQAALVAYNLILTTGAISVIPRSVRVTDQGKDVYGVNAAGTMGMITVRDARERDRWAELGCGRYLAEVTIPVMGDKTA
ncbi:ATP adenylyltransferase-like protein 2 [Elsinoe fawcettii]|nr:ATP adenylyltransferase-like protein 2 [Elsinoe fawcettii]